MHPIDRMPFCLGPPRGISSEGTEFPLGPFSKGEGDKTEWWRVVTWEEIRGAGKDKTGLRRATATIVFGTQVYLSPVSAARYSNMENETHSYISAETFKCRKSRPKTSIIIFRFILRIESVLCVPKFNSIASVLLQLCP